MGRLPANCRCPGARYPGDGPQAVSPVRHQSLDALCRRFGIDNSNRTLHGALLDSEILADVYLELIGGRQPDFASGLRRGDASGARRNRALAADRRHARTPFARPG